jgi:chromosomal replication initiation ATPase DnaA
MTRSDHINLHHHIALYAALHGVTVSDITGESKAQKYVQPRHMVWLDLICEPIGHKNGKPIYRSLPAIARQFSDRDHTTVLAGVRAMSAELYGTHKKARLDAIREAVQVGQRKALAA